VFDVDGAGVHAGHTGHTRLHRLAVDDAALIGDDGDGAAACARNPAVGRHFVAAPRHRIVAHGLAVRLQIENHVPRVEVPADRVGRAGVGTPAALRAGVAVHELLPREVVERLRVGVIEVGGDVGEPRARAFSSRATTFANEEIMWNGLAYGIHAMKANASSEWLHQITP